MSTLRVLRTAAPGRFVVLYDGFCRFCSRESKRLARLTRNRVEHLDFQEPGTLEALLAEVRLAKGANADFDRLVSRLERDLMDPADVELRARRVVEAMALALQASLLLRHAPAAVSDAFCATRLADDARLMFGAIPAGMDFAAIIERSRPKLN